jgi:hypothetical protein
MNSVRQITYRQKRLNRCRRVNLGSSVPKGCVSEYNSYPALHTGLLSAVPSGQRGVLQHFHLLMLRCAEFGVDHHVRHNFESKSALSATRSKTPIANEGLEGPAAAEPSSLYSRK